MSDAEYARVDTPTYYDVLEIREDASHDEIKIAYRRLALEYHPDRLPEEWRSRRVGLDAAEKFKDINDAHSVLSDPNRRRQYDLELRALRRTSGGETAANSG